MVAIALAGIIIGASGIAILVIFDSDELFEARGDLPPEELSFETGTEEILLLVAYTNAYYDPVIIDYSVYRMPDRELVKESTMIIDEKDQASDRAPGLIAVQYVIIDLEKTGRYNITMETFDDNGRSNYIVQVREMPMPLEFWDVLKWTMIVVLVVFLVLTVAIYYTHRKHTEIYIPLVPFVLADVTLAVATLLAF
jgi:hypothetical protein